MPDDVHDLEEGEDAVLEGDVPYRRGSARAALAHRDFRLVWSGSLASNIGTWMQNAALGALAFKLTQLVELRGAARLRPARSAARAVARRRAAGRLDRPADCCSSSARPSRWRCRSCSRSWPRSHTRRTPHCSSACSASASATRLSRSHALGGAAATRRHGGPGRRRVVAVGAAQPVTRDRPGDRWPASFRRCTRGACSPSTGSRTCSPSRRCCRSASRGRIPTRSEQGLRRVLGGFRVARRGRTGRPLPDPDHDVLVLLPAVHRPDAGDRRQEPRHERDRLRPTASCSPASASAPRSAPWPWAPCFVRVLEGSVRAHRPAAVRRGAGRSRHRCAPRAGVPRHLPRRSLLLRRRSRRCRRCCRNTSTRVCAAG